MRFKYYQIVCITTTLTLISCGGTLNVNVEDTKTKRQRKSGDLIAKDTSGQLPGEAVDGGLEKRPHISRSKVLEDIVQEKVPDFKRVSNQKDLPINNRVMVEEIERVQMKPGQVASEVKPPLPIPKAEPSQDVMENIKNQIDAQQTNSVMQVPVLPEIVQKNPIQSQPVQSQPVIPKVPEQSPVPNQPSMETGVFNVPNFSSIQELVGDNKPQEIVNGLLFSEGPVWSNDGYLLFTDIQGNKIYKWSEEQGLETYRDNSERANGLTILNDTNLVACEHRGRRVSISSLNGNKMALAEYYEGKRLNSPNDCVGHENGEVFFTDPPYGLAGQTSELGFNGVFRVNSMGVVTRLAANFPFNRPNGIAFSSNHKKIYIADTPANKVYEFDVDAKGDLSNGKTFTQINFPDGIKVDKFGNVYICGTQGILVLKADGSKVGTIQFPAQPANLAFGGQNMDTIYVTARSKVYRLKLNTVGK